MILISGLSYRLGTDVVNYISRFNNINIQEDFFPLTKYEDEYGWLALNYYCKSVLPDFVLVKLVISIFVNTTVFWFFRSHSRNFFTCVLLYYLFQYWNFNFEILRESISISIFLIALHQLIKETRANILKYCVLMLVASLFHHMAIFMMLLPFVAKLLKYNKLYIAILISCYLLSGILLLYLPDYVQLYLSGFYADVALDYMESEEYGEMNLNMVGIAFNFITTILPVILIANRRKHSHDIFVSFSLLYTLIVVLMNGLFILYRINNYLIFPTIIMFSQYHRVYVSDIGYNAIQKYRRIPMIEFILCWCLIIIGATNNKFEEDTYRRYTPYSSIFFKTINMERERIYYYD